MDDLYHTLTWPELQAYLEHWKTEPPLQVMVARYLGIPEREPPEERVQEMTQAEAVAYFAAAGFRVG